MFIVSPLLELKGERIHRQQEIICKQQVTVQIYRKICTFVVINDLCHAVCINDKEACMERF